MGSELLQSVQPIYNWLGGIMVPWGLILLFILTFLESIAFVGMFTPGEVVVVAAAFAATGVGIPLAWILIIAFLGGFIGVIFGYAVGRKLGFERMRTYLVRWSHTRVGRLLKLDPGVIDDVHDYFEKHGVLTVIGARFAYGAKSFVPPIAGAARMNFLKFAAGSGLGGLVYTSLLVLVGWLLQRNIVIAGTIMKSLGWFAGVVFALLVIFALVVLKKFADKRKAQFFDKHAIPHTETRALNRAFWKARRHADVVTSTNDWARESIAQGTPVPASFRAAQQSAGRGRNGRVWQSPQGDLFLTIVVPDTIPQPTTTQTGSFSLAELTGRIPQTAPKPNPATLALLSPLTALALVRMVRLLCYEYDKADAVEMVTIKWPNDVYLGSRKLAGILLEHVGSFVYIGVGLNLKGGEELAREQRAQETGVSPAYLSDIGINIDPATAALAFEDSFEELYSTWIASGWAPFAREYHDNERNYKHKVFLRDQRGVVVDEGYVRGYDDTGGLILADSLAEDAPRRVIVAGELSLRASES